MIVGRMSSAPLAKHTVRPLCHDFRKSFSTFPLVRLFVRLSACLCLCLCLCHTNLHVRVAMEAPPNRTKAHTTLPAAEEAQQQVAPLLWIPTIAVCVCLCSQHSLQLGLNLPTACGLHCPFATAVATKSRSAFAAQSSTSLEDQRSHGRTKTLRLLRLSSNCSHPRFRRTFFVTFCMRASHADVYPELLQDTREPREQIQNSAPRRGWRFAVVFHPSLSLSLSGGAGRAGQSPRRDSQALCLTSSGHCP